MSRLDESFSSSKKQYDYRHSIRKILDEKKSKMNLNKLIINNYELLQNDNDKSLDNYSDSEINNHPK
jgi:hypothetical protein